MAQYFENRGTLRELSRFEYANRYGDFETSRNYNEDRKKYIDWIRPTSILPNPVPIFVDNLFWKNTTVSFMVKSWTIFSFWSKRTLMSYVDAEGKNYFEIYSKDGKFYLASQLVEIDISAFDFAGEHMFTATRDWDTGIIKVWQDKTKIIEAPFTGSDFAIGDEPETSVLANEANDSIIVMEPSVINRGALNRNINLYLFGDAEHGAYARPYFAEFHIWDWAIEQEDVEEIYNNSMLTMAVDRLTRYLGEFKEVPPLARLGDSFTWVGTSNDLFQNGKVYWLTDGGWSILNNNAEYSVSA